MKAAISGETSNLRHPQCLAWMETEAEIDCGRHRSHRQRKAFVLSCVPSKTKKGAS
jgi:hypothetical protein